MPAYEGELFSPPAPVARISLRNPKSGKVVQGVPMLIDSGADVTLVPGSVLAELDIEQVSGKQYELLGFDGRPAMVPVANLELLFCRRTFRGQFLIATQPWGVLGRNVLNAVPLLLDGPRLVWDEHTRSG
jgi:hypothetical protein